MVFPRGGGRAEDRPPRDLGAAPFLGRLQRVRPGDAGLEPVTGDARQKVAEVGEQLNERLGERAVRRHGLDEFTARNEPAAENEPPRPAYIVCDGRRQRRARIGYRSEEHTSELQSLTNLVCRLLLEKKKKNRKKITQKKNRMRR